MKHITKTKPLKPHDVDDIWDIETSMATVRQNLEILDEHLPDLYKQLEELSDLISQSEKAKQDCKNWIEQHKNYKHEYMDYDAALKVFVGFYKRGQLSTNDSRLDPDDKRAMRIDVEGKFDRAIILKACVSTGTSWQKGFFDGDFDYSILWFRPEIKEYIEGITND